MSDTVTELEAATQQLADTVANLEAARAAEKAAAAPRRFVGHLSRDAESSTMIGPHVVSPGDNFVISTEDWMTMTEGGQAVLLDLLTSPARQRELLGGAWIREGEGPEVEWPVGSTSWYHQRRRRWAAAYALRDHDERQAELARLAEFYGSEAQTEQEAGHSVFASYRQLPPEPGGKVQKGRKQPPRLMPR